MQYGPKDQANVIKYISERIDEMASYYDSHDLCGEKINLEAILRDCIRDVIPYGSTATLRRWWDVFVEWGELPYVARQRRLEYDKKAGYRNCGRKLNETEYKILERIVMDDPNLYIDEIGEEFALETGICLNYKTLSEILKRDLNFRLKVFCEVARQRCFYQEQEILSDLSIYLQGHPELLICIDETHKDRNAARRRRGWFKKFAPAELKVWHKNCVRYTMLAAADINGFIPSACDTVMRDIGNSDEGAAGTVDEKYFLKWVKEYLCPVLGDYSKGEPRSVVLLDNASTHMQDAVVEATGSVGAVCLFGAPYSPHLNPIEKYFGIYKSYLKRHAKRMCHREQWKDVHHEALTQVDRDMGIKFFRHSKIPGSENMYTTDEAKELIENVAFLCNLL